MYQVKGQIINLFQSPASEKYEAAYRVQILGDMPMMDGQVKKEMLTLNVPKPVFDSLQGKSGKEISLPIGFYIKNGQLVTFYPKHGAEKSAAPGAGATAQG
jgi:hypothetical protein